MDQVLVWVCCTWWNEQTDIKKVANGHVRVILKAMLKRPKTHVLLLGRTLFPGCFTRISRNMGIVNTLLKPLWAINVPFRGFCWYWSPLRGSNPQKPLKRDKKGQKLKITINSKLLIWSPLNIGWRTVGGPAFYVYILEGQKNGYHKYQDNPLSQEWLEMLVLAYFATVKS